MDYKHLIYNCPIWVCLVPSRKKYIACGQKNHSDASKDGEPKKKQFHFNFINVFFFGGLPHFDCLLLECEDE